MRNRQDIDAPSGLLTSDQRYAAVDRACRALLPRMSPEHFFSGKTAAALWRLPLPSSVPVLPLDVSGVAPRRAPRTPGVNASRMQVDPRRDLTRFAGLPVTRPAETWAQLATSLTTDELIIVADALVGRRVLASVEELHRAAHRLRRVGVSRLDAAMKEVRTGSESPRETETRLVLVRGGLPEPMLNWELRDADGSLVARLDMAFPHYRVCVEYDGRHHAEDPRQFARDADRWDALLSAGWVNVRVLAHHYNDPRRLILDRARAALLARGWQP
ncbi:hypothetical protein ACFM35_00725 [Microbacterium sp. P01]|uniref:hypothetical protein n=1 Tax=Microbacterium sp. P01 TaxID=3366261 RepID=UPI0036732404